MSDKIGCMSEANLEYLKKHNSYLDFKKIEINPNTISPKFINFSSSEKENVKLKYSIPPKKKIFIYGGNLGKPQGLDFLLKTIQEIKRSDVFFLIIGSGTEFSRIVAGTVRMKLSVSGAVRPYSLRITLRGSSGQCAHRAAAHGPRVCCL